jgi:hypothetical protein
MLHVRRNVSVACFRYLTYIYSQADIPIYLSIYLPTYLSIYLSIYLQADYHALTDSETQSQVTLHLIRMRQPPSQAEQTCLSANPSFTPFT